MKKLKTILLLLLVPLLGFSQDQPKQSYSFSLEQAIGHALENNYKAINARRDIEIAKEKKWETTANGLPQVNAGIDYINNFKLQSQAITGGFPDANGNVADPNQILVLAFGTKQSMTARSTLSQLIFDGSYIVALQASKVYLNYYQNAKQKSDLEIREMVTTAYGNVLLAEESIAILNKNKSTLEKTLNDTQETFKNGLIEEENVEQLQITLSSINSNLNNTTRLREIAYKMLKIAIGVDINDDLTLTDKLDGLTVQNLDVALTGSSFNVKENVDYKIAENFTKQKNLEYKLERSKALPSLSANVNFGYNAFSNTFTFANTDQKWYNYSNLGVGLNIPIFSSFARSAKTQQAKIAFEQSKTQLTEAEQNLQLAYQSALSEYEFAVEEYNTAKTNLNLAERIERKQQVKFTEGLSSSFDFSEAQRQLYTAQQNYLKSMVDIVNKKAALEKITNNK